MPEFVNPYHFVPISKPTDDLVARGTETWPSHLTHASYVAGTHSGQFVCTLTTETPVVIGSARTPAADGNPADVEPFRDANGQPAIPSSSLRGLISSIYEAATNSALRVLTNTLYSVRVPAEPGKPLPFLGILQPGGIRKLDLQARRKIKGYEPRTSDALQLTPGSFLDSRNPESTSADHPDSWFAPEDGDPRNAEPTSASQSDSDVEGVLRILGIAGREKRLPMGRAQEIFVPFGDDDTVYEIEPSARETFEKLADQRTEEALDLPFQVKGAARNNNPELLGDRLRPRDGDLVFFRVGSDNRGREVVKEFAVSQIWRRAVGEAFDFFKQINKELLPFNPDRESLTLAEQVFGFVEDFTRHSQLERAGLALAGRLRFSDANLLASHERPFLSYESDGTPRSYVLKELSAPKPPCPAMYFTPKQASQAGSLIQKTDLKPGKHLPHGRKFYLHTASVPGNRQWETRDSEEGAAERKSRVRPLGSNLSFQFTIDFENLTDRELGFLLYSLQPTSAFRHKIGMGKPLGLGTIRISISEVRLIDRIKRYQQDDPFADVRHHQIYTDGAWVQEKIASIRKDDAIQFKTIEQIGDPVNAGGAAVHYPQVSGIDAPNPAFEQDLYAWFVANEKHAKPQERKCLTPLSGTGAIPTLPRHKPHKGKN